MAKVWQNPASWIVHAEVLHNRFMTEQAKQADRPNSCVPELEMALLCNLLWRPRSIRRSDAKRNIRLRSSFEYLFFGKRTNDFGRKCFEKLLPELLAGLPFIHVEVGAPASLIH